MQKSFCGIHIDEEEKYLCIHPNCIKEKENKLCCIECFEKHAQDRTEFHQKVSLYLLLQKAKTNKEAFTKLQENNIIMIQSFYEESQNQLLKLVQQTKLWQENSLKLLKNSTEAYITQLQQELKKADTHYVQDQLDNQIYFYLLDYSEQNRLSQESLKNTKRYIKLKIRDYEQQTQLLTKQNWGLQNIFQTLQGQYKLLKSSQQDIKFEKCQEHNEKKNQLQIQQKIKRSEIGVLYCTKCLINSKISNIVISSIRNVSDLINEEKQKTAQQKEELLQFKQNLLQLIDSQYLLIVQKQKEHHEYFESLKEKILCIENEVIQKLMTPPQCDFIFGDIDYNKLFLTHSDIKKSFSTELTKVEAKIKPLINIIINSCCLSYHIELEKTVKQQTDKISQLENEINLEKQKQARQQQGSTKPQSSAGSYKSYY